MIIFHQKINVNELAKIEFIAASDSEYINIYVCIINFAVCLFYPWRWKSGGGNDSHTSRTMTSELICRTHIKAASTATTWMWFPHSHPHIHTHMRARALSHRLVGEHIVFGVLYGRLHSDVMLGDESGRKKCEHYAVL